MREAASRELEAVGEPALPALRAAAVTDDPEIRRRADEIVLAIRDRMLEVAARPVIAGLQGTWHSTSIEIDGVRQAGEDKSDRHFFAGDQWTCKNGDVVVQAGKVKIVEISDKLAQSLLPTPKRNGDGQIIGWNPASQFIDADSAIGHARPYNLLRQLINDLRHSAGNNNGKPVIGRIINGDPTAVDRWGGIRGW